ncbi:AI-2E family transporter [bacterium]|nr:AI-2E family transporter [bacterium]
MVAKSKKFFQQKHSTLIFTILALITLGFVLVIAKPYLNAIILAVIVAYIVQPIYKFLTQRLKTKKVNASLLSTALIILLTLIIGIALGIAAVNIVLLISEQVNNLQLDNSTTTAYLQDGIDWINLQMYKLNIPIVITIREVIDNLRSSLTGLLDNVLATVTSISSFSVDAFFNLMIFYGLTFVIIPNFDEIVAFVKKALPFEEEITTLYIKRSLETAKAMVWGMLIIALAQSVLAGLVLYSLGTPYILLIMLLVALFSFIPLLGTGIVILPIAGVYILSGQILKGLILAIFQIILIGNIDTVLRVKLIPKDVRMSIFVSFIAIFGGLSIWGIWGLIYGPVIFMLLLTTIEVINKYYFPSRGIK